MKSKLLTSRVNEERQKEMNGWLNKQMRLPKMYVSLQF